MEVLSESVYECSLAVEAHMICDLLARAGISARVDGEFLAGVGGELPLGSTIKVRVAPASAAEAREVIRDWEKAQPHPDPISVPKPRSSWRSPSWFLAGVMIGGGLMVFALRTPYTSQEVHTDGDGIVDEVYHYRGQVIDSVDYDRNADRKIDARWFHDVNGIGKRYENDDDFDGQFEWVNYVEDGEIVRSELDADGNGRPEIVALSKHGVVRTREIYDATGSHIAAREEYVKSRLLATEYDRDGDGIFERRVEHDELGEPITTKK
jgi:hypothetical protein